MDCRPANGKLLIIHNLYSYFADGLQTCTRADPFADDSGLQNKDNKAAISFKQPNEMAYF